MRKHLADEGAEEKNTQIFGNEGLQNGRFKRDWTAKLSEMRVWCAKLEGKKDGRPFTH